ncbi:mutarotase [Pedobacter sp. CCM 8938]|uniref:Mutarotase n=1 Tax=Pedobacter fastidiosus TaxID=2765361 RepID=A0ABR7KT16_9SPHI|nr:mutarotase [Pedobacter fastidiosus]MBC6111259.1 mutarotase [Pedobacter fastidiosus]
MNLKEHYSNLYQESFKKIADGNYEIDPLLDSQDDYRYGITLVARPSLVVKNKIQSFLTELKTIDGEQYYYQNSDLHITVMSLISCYTGFNLNQISVPEYIETVEKSLAGIKSFNVHFKGLTLSPSCVIVQGFFDDDTLKEIRNKLRRDFRNSGLEQSIDKRYSIQTAHSTIVRFRKELKDKNGFLALIEKHKNYDFGTFTVANLELVYNDWHQRQGLVKHLHNFKLI